MNHPEMERPQESYKLFGHHGPFKDCMGVYHEYYRECHFASSSSSSPSSSSTNSAAAAAGSTTMARSTFRHEKLPIYLYFHDKDGTWNISNAIGSSRIWMFAPDSAKKPHLIVAPWRYVDSEAKKWRLEKGLAIEPKMYSGSAKGQHQKKIQSLRMQAEAMNSVIEAIRAENDILKAKIAERAEDERTGGLVGLRQQNRLLRRRLVEAKEDMKALEGPSKDCARLKLRRTQLDAEARDLMAQISQKEEYLKQYQGVITSRRNSVAAVGEKTTAVASIVSCGEEKGTSVAATDVTAKGKEEGELKIEALTLDAARKEHGNAENDEQTEEVVETIAPPVVVVADNETRRQEEFKGIIVEELDDPDELEV
mmetsp:Transcript_5544/g.9270  ORF Transcript_5544/g.9270 Transcript_5544/m.9270 type:complete len:367 (-) Transcript_5544:171-1271(-)